MARSKKRRRPNAATPPIDAARAQRVYAAFADASDAFFENDEAAKAQAKAMELDGPMADLRGCLALLAARAKPSCLVAFGRSPRSRNGSSRASGRRSAGSTCPRSRYG